MIFSKERAKRYVTDLKKYVYEQVSSLGAFRYICENSAEFARVDFDDSEWPELSVGEPWGGPDLTMWLRKKVAIPADWANKNLALVLVLGTGHGGGLGGAESLLYINGEPVHGLDRNHAEVNLRSQWIQSGEITVAIKAFSGLRDQKHLLERADLVVINPQAEDFYYRLKTLYQTIETIDSSSVIYQELLETADQAINRIDFRQPGSPQFYASIEAANKFLKESLTSLRSDQERRPVVHGVGHSHIDVAWLWRLLHTREKSSRTFSTVLHLMDQYPEYQFVQSQPQLYDYLKSDYPQLYDKIKQKIKEGQWEVTGGMWVEADCNVTSGESLVRQFLFGTRFLKEEFGVECSVLWLPDVFGYSWALPQIIKKSGLKYFMTTKISWSQFNRPPHDTFTWRGIDGSEVLTHYITTPVTHGAPFYTYNGILDPESVKGIWDNYSDKEINDQLLLAYGYGDGGGGPTKEMLETGRKMQELPALPEVRFNKVEPFFAQLDANVSGRPNLPVWDGELYLEYHRGTYTSQAEVKKNNRWSEILLHNVELFGSLTKTLLDDYVYPQEDVNNNWKTVLRNQFHDILPGSSIHQVYEDSAREFAEVQRSAQHLLKKALEKVAAEVSLSGDRLVVFNPLSWARRGTVVVDWDEKLAGLCAVNNDGERFFGERCGPDGKYWRIELPEIPALGYATYRLEQTASQAEVDNELTVTTKRIENRYYRIELNDSGQIVSLYDKEFAREVLLAGEAGNQLQTFEDRPMNYDAWDIDIYYTQKKYVIDQLIEAVVEDAGPQRGVVRFKWQYLDSTIEQRMIIYRDSRRIDFATEVDWHQHQVLLKAAFPVDVRATKATYEIQFGNAERPTHWNTSWDYARFETPAQKWADLSERDYGVSLLNDCKYGYDIKDQVMRITLIKSGIQPDPQADQGHHSFTYSLLPHGGDWYMGQTVKEAYELNYPLIGVAASGRGGSLPEALSLAAVSGQSTILETVKKAEDDASLILRFYEYAGRRDQVSVNLAQPIGRVVETDLMEKELDAVAVQNSQFSFELKPYEIKTFKVKMQ